MASCCECCSRWSLPTVLWSVLSLVSATLCSLGIYFSNWLERETDDGALNSVSAFRLCLNESSQLSTSCNSYFTFSEIYSPQWQAVTLLMGLGACMLVFTALISLFLLCVHGFCNTCLMCTNAVIQGLGGRSIITQYWSLCIHFHTAVCLLFY